VFIEAALSYPLRTAATAASNQIQSDARYRFGIAGIDPECGGPWAWKPRRSWCQELCVM